MTTPVPNLSTRAFAARCGVVPETVRRWVAEKRLEPAGRTPGGHYRFTEAQVSQALVGPPRPEADAHTRAVARAKVRALRASFRREVTE